MRILLILLLCVICMSTSAQHYRIERKLDTVTADGFYRIDLSPELIPDLNDTFSNVRITDDHDQEIPFLLQQEQPTHYTTVFRPYRIVQYDKTKNCCTSIILENPEDKPINNIHLSIRNADVTKEMTLTASDDRQNWYALKSKFTITAAGDQQRIWSMRIVDFPMSNYAFYKIDIADSTSAPLNITAAGYFEVSAEEGKYMAVPFTWHKADSAAVKSTFIRIRFERSQIPDRIVLSMKGAPYFLRKGWVLREERSDKKNKMQYKRVAAFTVSSRHPAIIELAGFRETGFIIQIENEDNPALDVASIQVDQLNRYLAAWLGKGKEYALKFGALDLKAPQYDIVNFRDSIPDILSSVAVGPAVTVKQPSIDPGATVFTSRVVIWIAIVAVITVLAFMAVRMVREM